MTTGQLDEARRTGIRQRETGRLWPNRRIDLAVEIVDGYWLARRSLRKLPIEDAVARQRRAPSTHAERLDGPAATAEAARLGRAVTRLLAHLPGDTRCLVRSLVLTRLLARRGIDSTLVIGARTSPHFLAHAWVEHDGDPVLDPGDGSFGRLVEL